MENIDVSDDFAVELSLNMQCASRALHLAIANELSRHGLLPSEFEVLRRLAAESGGAMRTGELAGAATTTFSGMSRLVDRMIIERLVTRTSSTSDRRVQYVTITDAGRKRLAEARSAYHNAVSEVLSEAGLQSRRSATLAQLLAELGRVGR